MTSTNMIRLTDYDQRDIYLNPKFITKLIENKPGFSPICSTIWLDDGSQHEVRESVNTILGKMKELEQTND